jgi:hypothetical protein
MLDFLVRLVDSDHPVDGASLPAAWAVESVVLANLSASFRID